MLLLLMCVIIILYLLNWMYKPIAKSRIQKHACTYNYTYKDKDEEKKNFPNLYDEYDEKNDPLISFIAPAYNEEERLPIFLEKTCNYLVKRTKESNNRFKWELIIVDDGSKDKTYDISMKYTIKYGANCVRVLRLDVNQGKGGAVQQGMLHARGKYLLMLDSDAATEIEDIERLEKSMKSIEKNDLGCVIGSRSHLKDDAVATRKWYRNVLMYGMHIAVQLFCIKGIKDTQCGFKLFSRKTAQLIFPEQQLRRWSFDVEILKRCSILKIPIKETAVNWKEIPGSKVDLLDTSIKMARDLVVIWFAFKVGTWKTKTFDYIKKES